MSALTRFALGAVGGLGTGLIQKAEDEKKEAALVGKELRAIKRQKMKDRTAEKVAKELAATRAATAAELAQTQETAARVKANVDFDAAALKDERDAIRAEQVQRAADRRAATAEKNAERRFKKTMAGENRRAAKEAATAAKNKLKDAIKAKEMSASDARIVTAAMKAATTSGILDKDAAVATILNYGKSQGDIEKWRTYAEVVASEKIGEGNMTMTQALAKAEEEVDSMATWGSTDATDFKDLGGTRKAARQAIANRLFSGGKANAQTSAGAKVNPVPVVSATEPEMTGTQTRQAKLDHIAAQGNFAKKIPPAQRSDDNKKAIRDFLKALGTPTKSWEEEESRLNIGEVAGSRDNPHRPTTISDMDGIKPGESYINPTNNKMYTRKGLK